METNPAKVLDEACNCNNDAYRDEALYAPWAQAPSHDAANDPTLTPRPPVDTFMARLYACQE